MTLTIINATQVKELLPMSACIQAMEEAMLMSSTGKTAIPPRSFHQVMGQNATYGLMPGSSEKLSVYGTKLISLHPDNPARGLPLIQGFVALFDTLTGTPVAILDGASMTAIRTAAVSGLASKYLARAAATTCGIMGTGVQAETHIEAICCVRPIEQIVIWGRNQDKAQALADTLQPTCKATITVTEDPRKAANCEIICTVTAAHTPILPGNWVKAGTHINIVGAHTAQNREVDSALMQKAIVYTDSLDSLFREGGDVLIPLAEGSMEKSQIIGEIGQVIAGTIPARINGSQITVYKSHGMTAQDLWAADLILRNAAAKNIGTKIEL